MELSFIIIDDTELDHFIAKKMIGNVNKAFAVTHFLDASLALEHIVADSMEPGIKIILIFLDIYMPMMNGFQFMDEFEKLHPDIRQKYYIMALTSSKEVSDINRINSYPSFKNMLNKPLVAQELNLILSKIIKDYNIDIN